MPEIITSLQNSRIKSIVKLQEKSQERRREGLFVVEGVNEIRQVLNSGLKIDSVFLCPEVMKELTVADFEGSAVFHVSPAVFEKIAYREDSGGALLVVHSPASTLSALMLSANPLLIVLESVEKPGNLGAILRTADGAGADAVIVCDPRTDIWNPNVIRSSIGCVFSVPAVSATSEETLRFLKDKNIRVLAAALPGSVRHDRADFSAPSAIVFGTEADGLSDFWLKNADEVIRIPMLGKADSLNVSTSAAIIVYEAQRQRGFQANR